jgi:hypothetical protein
MAFLRWCIAFATDAPARSWNDESLSSDPKLYWKKGNGRWTAYYDDRGDAFVGSLADCLREISRDPFSCYWS